eukprot:TRINITY_DN981_c0_g2_i1.p1 TRINITY_DN981_c0_g2~~TRINITY_DN981_c0_g2_i1.p1  ORF type:complete len:1905 (-),score=652.61 TRINITY_DN981_c0_g2_i1:1204-6918(-)
MSSRSKLSDFVFMGELGRGSYGVVYRVRRKADGRIYVIKQIQITSLSAREQEDAINEVKILASLDHSNIVKYYDSFLDKKQLNIVMEFAEHGNLQDFLKKRKGKRLPENLVWSFFIQIACGLYHVHRKRVLHRDLKSLNVFLDKNDRVKLGDFGVAKVLGNTKSFAMTLVGTPYYLSPELCENKPYNEKSDVWALGCILYELCTMKHPFDAINQGALILKIVRGKYPQVSSFYSQDLRNLVDSCLARSTSVRPTVKQILLRDIVVMKAASLKVELPSTLRSSIEKKKPHSSTPSSTSGVKEVPSFGLSSHSGEERGGKVSDIGGGKVTPRGQQVGPLVEPKGAIRSRRTRIKPGIPIEIPSSRPTAPVVPYVPRPKDPKNIPAGPIKMGWKLGVDPSKMRQPSAPLLPLKQHHHAPTKPAHHRVRSALGSEDHAAAKPSDLVMRGHNPMMIPKQIRQPQKGGSKRISVRDIEQAEKRMSVKEAERIREINEVMSLPDELPQLGDEPKRAIPSPTIANPQPNPEAEVQVDVQKDESHIIPKRMGDIKETGEEEGKEDEKEEQCVDSSLKDFVEERNAVDDILESPAASQNFTHVDAEKEKDETSQEYDPNGGDIEKGTSTPRKEKTEKENSMIDAKLLTDPSSSPLTSAVKTYGDTEDGFQLDEAENEEKELPHEDDDAHLSCAKDDREESEEESNAMMCGDVVQWCVSEVPPHGDLPEERQGDEDADADENGKEEMESSNEKSDDEDEGNDVNERVLLDSDDDERYDDEEHEEEKEEEYNDNEEKESSVGGNDDDDDDDDEDDEDDDDDGAAEDLTLLDLRDYVRELEDIIEKVTKSLVVDKIEVLFKQDLVNDIRKKKDLLIVFVRDRIVEELAEGVSKRDIHRLEELKAHYSLVPDDMWREAELQKAAADVLIRQYHACEEMLKELTKGIDEQNIAMLSDLVQRKGTWNEAVNAKLDIAKWLVLQSESDMRVSKRLQDAISVRNARLIEEIVAGIEKMRGDRGDRKTFLELVKMGNEASELLETWKGRGSEPESETLHKETVIGKGDGTGASDIKQGEKSVTIASAALVGGGAAAALVAGSLVASRNDESEERVDEISESVQEQGERENSESDGKLSSHGGMKEWKEDGDGTGDDTSHEHHEKSGEKDDGIVKESVSTASSCEEVVKHGDELDVEGQYESAMKGETIDLLRKPLVGNPLYVQSLSHLLGILELVMKDPQYLEGLRDHALVVSEDIAFVVIGDHFVAYDEEVYRKALQTRLKTLSETYHAAMMMKEKAAAEEHLLALQELTEFYSSKIRRGRVIEFPFGSKISVLYDPVSKHWSLLRCPCPPPLALPSDEELARARALWASGTAPPLQFDRLQTRVESDDHTAKRVFAGQSSSTSHEISRRASDALSGPEMKPIQEAGDASGSADLSGANDERSPQDVRAGEAILREIGRSMEDLGEWRKLHGEGVVMVPNSPFTLRLILLMMEGLHHGFKSTRFLLRRTPFDVIVSAADASSYVHGILHTFTSECRVFVFMEEEDIEFSTGHCAYMLLFLMYTMNMHNVHDVLSLALGSANLKKFYHPHALMLNSVFQNAFLDAILPIQRYGFNLPTENIRAFENFTRVLFSTDRPVLPRQPVDPSEAAAVASLPPPMPAPLPESSSPFQQSGVTVVKDDGSQKVLPASETDTESSTRKGGGRESSPPPQPPQVSDKVRDTPLGQISLARYPPVMQQLISVYDLFVSHFARESSADDPRALEALGNEERHAEVGVLVRRDLCNVLAGILLPGFRSKRRFGRDQTLYDMFVFLGKDIRDENEIVSNGTNVVSVMIGDGFDAGIRFRALVCYALNVGILHKMFELLFRNSATLAKYYDLFDSGTDLLIANPHFRFDCVRVIAALEKFRFHVAINGETRMRPPSM